jgi:transcriptional regulator with XRE-family HTH domain
MDPLGETIRSALKAKNMTSTDLGKLVDLNPRTIDNIIHGKSRKESLLRRISIALGIDLLKYSLADEKPKELEDINIDIYNKASSEVALLIKKENIYINKSLLDALITLTYKFIIQDVNITKREIAAFIKGMIKFGLHHFILNYKSSSESTETQE